ncbi:FkbM family methyltransferase, partial [Rhizobiaceae sp. 2RAB30]
TQSVSSGEIADTIASSLMRRDVHMDAPVSEVEIVDLVAYIEALSEPVRILKLDIEGYEAEVLEAILDARLDRRIDLILVETHEQFSSELARRIGAIRDRIAAEGIDNICLGWR